MKKKGQPNEFGIFVKASEEKAPARVKAAPAPEPVVEAVEVVEEEPKKKKWKKHEHDDVCEEGCDL